MASGRVQQQLVDVAAGPPARWSRPPASRCASCATTGSRKRTSTDFTLREQHALQRLAVERGIDRQPVLAHQRAVDEAITHALFGRALHAGGIAPAGARKGDAACCRCAGGEHRRLQLARALRCRAPRARTICAKSCATTRMPRWISVMRVLRDVERFAIGSAWLIAP